MPRSYETNAAPVMSINQAPMRSQLSGPQGPIILSAWVSGPRLGTRSVAVHFEVATPEAGSPRRFRARAEAGERHAAHNDVEFADQMESGTKDTSVYRVELPWPRIAVDASDVWGPGLDDVRDFVLSNRRTTFAAETETRTKRARDSPFLADIGRYELTSRITEAPQTRDLLTLGDTR